MPLLAEVLFAQDGVISRQQAIDCGASEGLLRSMLRRGAWVRLHPGVYEPQRPADVAAARLGGGVGCAGLGAEPSVCADHRRVGTAGCCDSHRRRPQGARPRARGRGRPPMCTVDAARGGGMRPPRVRVEHAVLDVAGEAPSEVDAIAVLADTVRERLTTASRLHSALDSRQWCKRRRLISGVLTDLNEGTCSVLEHAYLTRVERPHGLPKPRRRWHRRGSDGAVSGTSTTTSGD